MQTSEMYGRSPAEWLIVSNEGGNVVARNLQTNDSFTGSLSNFQKLFKPVVDGTSLLSKETREVKSMLERRRIVSQFWSMYRNYLMTLYPPVPNTATVKYIDPNGGAGLGTFADPMNNIPASPVNDTTYLLKERTRIVAAGRWSGITATGLVIGTYDACTGARVFEPSRLATIDGNTYFRAVVRWQGTTGTFTLSGVRLIGGTNATTGGIQQFESITAPAASTITVEHCVFEFMGAYLLNSSQINNQCIAVNGPKLIARFNRMNAEADGISFNPASLAGCQIIGNHITVPASIIAGGPDCIQIQRTSTNPIGKTLLLGNWLHQNANTKQAFLITGGTPQATNEELFAAHNFFMGVDTSVSPLAPFVNGQIAFINDSTSRSTVVSNYFDGFCGWASVGSNSILMNNIGIRAHDGEWLVGFGTKSGSSGSVVANNTTIAPNNVWADGNSDKGLEIAGSFHTVKNNLCVNMCLKMAPDNIESNNLFVGTKPVDLSNVPLALGVGSEIMSEAFVDSIGRPLQGSPALSGGAAVEVESMLQRYPDPFNQASLDPSVAPRGAAQGWDTLQV